MIVLSGGRLEKAPSFEVLPKFKNDCLFCSLQYVQISSRWKRSKEIILFLNITQYETIPHDEMDRIRTGIAECLEINVEKVNVKFMVYPNPASFQVDIREIRNGQLPKRTP